MSEPASHDEEGSLRSYDFPGEAVAAFRAELKRRMAEIRAGTVVGVPIEETLAQLREEYP